MTRQEMTSEGIENLQELLVGPGVGGYSRHLYIQMSEDESGHAYVPEGMASERLSLAYRPDQQKNRPT